MNRIARLSLVSIVLALAATAAPIPGLVSTGGSTPGTQDPAWQWFYTPVATNTYNFVPAWVTDDTSYPFPHWVANDANSKWISPQQGYGTPYDNYADAVGLHYFLLMYNIPAGYDPNTATFTFELSTDNLLNSAWVNSSLIMNGGVVGYSAMQGPFTVGPTPGMFHTGWNSLVFIITNQALPNQPNPSDPNTWNPVGLRVNIVNSFIEGPSEMIPEPGALYLCAAGLITIGLLRRRKQA